MEAPKKRNEPDVGNVYRHRYKGTMYELTVVKTSGGIGYELLGNVYSSPTAAAKALVGKDQPTNGRTFWHID
jgi:hypothetical protein